MTEKSTKSSTNKTGLQPVSGYVNMSPYFKGWGVGARSCGIKAVQTDRETWLRSGQCTGDSTCVQ